MIIYLIKVIGLDTEDYNQDKFYMGSDALLKKPDEEDCKLILAEILVNHKNWIWKYIGPYFDILLKNTLKCDEDSIIYNFEVYMEKAPKHKFNSNFSWPIEYDVEVTKVKIQDDLALRAKKLLTHKNHLIREIGKEYLKNKEKK